MFLIITAAYVTYDIWNKKSSNTNVKFVLKCLFNHQMRAEVLEKN